MTAIGAALLERIASALVATGAAVERQAPHRWTLRQPGAPPIGVALDDDWMSWSMPLPADVEIGLLSGRAWPAGVKAARSPGDETAVARCEWPVDHEVDVERRAREINSGLTAMAPAGARVPGDEPPTSTRNGGSPEGVSLAPLHAICDGAGWAVMTERDEGLSVARAGAGSGSPVEIAIADGASVRVRLELARGPAPCPAAAPAIDAVLVAAARRVRFARPYADRGVEGSVAVGFEVDLGHRPVPTEITHALAAVAAAAAVCRDACALLLEQPAIAREVAGLMAWTRVPGRASSGHVQG
jgi:hypothetical protein